MQGAKSRTGTCAVLFYDMKLLYKYTIPLDPRTKKNHMQICGTGKRCPICHKAERQFIRQGKAHEMYHILAEPYCTPRPPMPISTPVWVKYTFFMKTKRRVDTLNLCACIDDLLVDAHVISDDNSNIIVSHDGTRVFADKENPRTEIEIYEYDYTEDDFLDED